jgi:hypothetical protein
VILSSCLIGFIPLLLSTFINDPETCINEAFDKRKADFNIMKKLFPETLKFKQKRVFGILFNKFKRTI